MQARIKESCFLCRSGQSTATACFMLRRLQLRPNLNVPKSVLNWNLPEMDTLEPLTVFIYVATLNVCWADGASQCFTICSVFGRGYSNHRHTAGNSASGYFYIKDIHIVKGSVVKRAFLRSDAPILVLIAHFSERKLYSSTVRGRCFGISRKLGISMVDKNRVEQNSVLKVGL